MCDKAMGAEGTGTTMRAGAGKATIRLEDVLPFDGFDAQQDDLHVRALVVDSGRDERAETNRCCIVSVEATSLKPEVVGLLRGIAVESTGCNPRCVWITVTHTFSSPHVRTASHLVNDDERARNARLLGALTDATKTAVADASRTLAPARMAWSEAGAPVNVNRDVETPAGWWLGRNPEGYADHAVPALWLLADTDEVTPLAVVFSADVQSSVLHGSADTASRHLVSGDLAGVAMAAVEAALSGCTAIFLTGAAGDQAPATDNLGALATGLASAVTRSLAQAAPLSSGTIEAEELVLNLPGQERADFATLAPTRSYRYMPAPPVPTTLSLLRLGPTTLVGVLPELDSSLGSRVRALAPHTMLATLVNGGQKYLPGGASYDHIAYEAMNSAFAQGADRVLLSAIERSIS